MMGFVKYFSKKGFESDLLQVFERFVGSMEYCTSNDAKCSQTNIFQI